MNAEQKDRNLASRLLDHMPVTVRLGRSVMDNVSAIVSHARTLRRAQLTLHRWAEEMCNGTIQREGPDGNGRPFRPQYSNYYERIVANTPIPDRERGALARVERVCKEAGLYYYHQTDPRGCALFVAAEPLTSQNYSTKGVACL